MEVFGKGEIRPLMAPAVCIICQSSPQQEVTEVIQTGRRWLDLGPHHMAEVYVCGDCARELGAAVGQVPGDELNDAIVEAGQVTADLNVALAKIRELEEMQPKVVPVDELEAKLQELTEAARKSAPKPKAPAKKADAPAAEE